MNNYNPKPLKPLHTADIPPDMAAELSDWFSVSGDMDDFIYYGEEKFHSEK